MTPLTFDPSPAIDSWRAPYAQHFQTTSFPAASPITTREGLEKAVLEMNSKSK